MKQPRVWGRRAKVRGLFIEHVYREQVLIRYDGLCGICGQPLDPLSFEIDHIIPASRGGKHSYDNVQPAHGKCNRQKADRMPDEHHNGKPLGRKKRNRKSKGYRNFALVNRKRPK